MEPFDPSMFPHLVQLLPETDSQDTTGSVLENFPGLSYLPLLPCYLRFTGPSQTSYGAGDIEVTVTPATLAFPKNPGCKKGDRYRRATDGVIARVFSGAREKGGDGVLFVTTCEVRD
jgi:hypothetical protein